MMVTSRIEVARDTPPSGQTRALRLSGVGLVAASWISASAFAAYIFAFYLGAIPGGRLEQWNGNISGLYDKNNHVALASMTAHLAMGAIVLLMGPVQLVAAVRTRWPALHRWLGRIYIVTSAVAGLGGLLFIVFKGTIGGAVMNIGFGLYGALMVVAAFEAWRHAVARRFDAHRAWAIRLFALAIGSWLYRMDFGFWLIAVHRIGHQEDFRGPFDMVMSFFFYLPNLAIAELFLRSRRRRSNTGLRAVALLILNLATLIVAVGTYYFVRFYWGPGILDALRGHAS